MLFSDRIAVFDDAFNGWGISVNVSGPEIILPPGSQCEIGGVCVDSYVPEFDS